jgi:hypothetical protein
VSWVHLIFVGIGVAIWIATNLRDSKLLPKSPPEPPPLPPPDRPRNQDRAAVDDLQEFLRKIRTQPDAAPKEEPVLVVQESRPAPPAFKPKKRKQRAADVAAATPNAVAGLKRTAEVTSFDPPPLKLGEPLKVEPTPAVANVRTPSKAAQTAVNLVKSRDGVATAFVLGEILGPPRCKRKRTRIV